MKEENFLTFLISPRQVMNNRSVEQHLNEATSIVIYSPVNRLNTASNQQTSASRIATYTISGNPTTTTVATTNNNGNDQGDSPLLSFCSVTNTLLNQ